MTFRKDINYGFTLLEILLVIGIIAILAGIVIVAINPGRQLAKIRNTERRSDIRQIHSALEQYYIDNSHYLTALTTTATEICNTGNATSTHDISCGSLIDLSVLVPTYLVAIPTDPTGEISTNGAGYKVALNASRKLYLQASQAEVSEIIVLGSEAGVAGTDWDIPAGWTTPTVTGTARYWVANSTGNWNDTANWSATSGGTGGASVPGSTNDAIFDGDGDGNCTINATVNVKGLILEGYHGTIFQGAYAVTVGADGYVQGSGTFSGSTSAITINGQYVIGGGTFTSTSGTLTVAGNFTKSGGSFGHNSGTVLFTSTISITTGGAVFNNVILTASGAYIITLNDDINIDGNLTVNGNNTFGGSRINAVSTSTIYLAGNYSQPANGQWYTVFGYSGTINLILDGSTNQTISGSSAGFKVNLTIAKSGGSALLGSNFTIYDKTLTINSGSTFDCSSDSGITSYDLGVGNTFTNRNTGVFLARTGSHSFTGGFINLGTFNAGSSTVTFYGDISITTGGAVFNNVILTASGAYIITLNDDINIDGNLTVNGNNTFGGSRINAVSTSTIYLAGNYSQPANGQWYTVFGYSGTINLILDGSTNQTISGSSAGFKVNLTIAKSGGSALLGSNFTVTSPKVLTVNTGNTLNKMGYTLTGTVVNNGTIIP